MTTDLFALRKLEGLTRARLLDLARLATLFLSWMLLAACGGGGGSGDAPAPHADEPAPPPTVPSGTWFGTREDSAGVMGTFDVTISGNQITQIRNNGVVATGLTATITHRSRNLFSLTLSDGTVGAFFMNSAQTHAAFIGSNSAFGVVQRGASALPGYSFTDLNGRYTVRASPRRTLAASASTSPRS